MNYEQLVNVGSKNLTENEFWCVIDPGGIPIIETASKRFDESVLIFCDALRADWEDAKEVGYRLGRTTR